MRSASGRQASGTAAGSTTTAAAIASSTSVLAVAPQASTGDTSDGYSKLLSAVGNPNYEVIRDLFAGEGCPPASTVPAIHVSFELFEAVQNRLSATKQVLERTKADLLTRNQQYATLYQEMHNLQDEYAVVSKRAVEAEDRNTHLHQKHAKMEVTLEQLRREVGQGRTALDAFQEKLRYREAELQSSQNRVAESLVALSQRDAVVSTLRRELGKYRRLGRSSVGGADGDDDGDGGNYTAETLRSIAEDVEGRSLEARMKLNLADVEARLTRVEEEKGSVLAQHTQYRHYVESALQSFEMEAMIREDAIAGHHCVYTPYYLSSEIYRNLMYEDRRQQRKEGDPETLATTKAAAGGGIPSFMALTVDVQKSIERLSKVNIDPSSRLKDELNICVEAQRGALQGSADLIGFLSTMEEELLHRRLSLREVQEEWAKARVPEFAAAVAAALQSSTSTLSKGLVKLLQRENELTAGLEATRATAAANAAASQVPPSATTTDGPKDRSKSIRGQRNSSVLRRQDTGTITRPASRGVDVGVQCSSVGIPIGDGTALPFGTSSEEKKAAAREERAPKTGRLSMSTSANGLAKQSSVLSQGSTVVSERRKSGKKSLSHGTGERVGSASHRAASLHGSENALQQSVAYVTCPNCSSLVPLPSWCGTGPGTDPLNASDVQHSTPRRKTSRTGSGRPQKRTSLSPTHSSSRSSLVSHVASSHWTAGAASPSRAAEQRRSISSAMRQSKDSSLLPALPPQSSLDAATKSDVPVPGGLLNAGSNLAQDGPSAADVTRVGGQAPSGSGSGAPNGPVISSGEVDGAQSEIRDGIVEDGQPFLVSPTGVQVDYKEAIAQRETAIQSYQSSIASKEAELASLRTANTELRDLINSLLTQRKTQTGTSSNSAAGQHGIPADVVIDGAALASALAVVSGMASNPLIADSLFPAATPMSGSGSSVDGAAHSTRLSLSHSRSASSARQTPQDPSGSVSGVAPSPVPTDGQHASSAMSNIGDSSSVIVAAGHGDGSPFMEASALSSLPSGADALRSSTATATTAAPPEGPEQQKKSDTGSSSGAFTGAQSGPLSVSASNSTSVGVDIKENEGTSTGTTTDSTPAPPQQSSDADKAEGQASGTSATTRLKHSKKLASGGATASSGAASRGPRAPAARTVSQRQAPGSNRAATAAKSGVVEPQKAPSSSHVIPLTHGPSSAVEPMRPAGAVGGNLLSSAPKGFVKGPGHLPPMQHPMARGPQMGGANPAVYAGAGGYMAPYNWAGGNTAAAAATDPLWRMRAGPSSVPLHLQPQRPWPMTSVNIGHTYPTGGYEVPISRDGVVGIQLMRPADLRQMGVPAQHLHAISRYIMENSASSMRGWGGVRGMRPHLPWSPSNRVGRRASHGAFVQPFLYSPNFGAGQVPLRVQPVVSQLPGNYRYITSSSAAALMQQQSSNDDTLNCLKPSYVYRTQRLAQRRPWCSPRQSTPLLGRKGDLSMTGTGVRHRRQSRQEAVTAMELQWQTPQDSNIGVGSLPPYLGAPKPQQVPRGELRLRRPVVGTLRSAILQNRTTGGTYGGSAGHQHQNEDDDDEPLLTVHPMHVPGRSSSQLMIKRDPYWEGVKKTIYLQQVQPPPRERQSSSPLPPRSLALDYSYNSLSPKKKK